MSPSESTIRAVLAGARTIGAVEVAGASLLAYDYILTISDEVELVWRSKWSAGKILFLLARYLVLPQHVLILCSALLNPTHIDCRIADIYAIWTLMLGITAGDGVLVLRTWAIWDGRKAVLIALAAVLCATTALNCYIAVDFVHGLRFDSAAPLQRAIGYHICIVTARNDRIGVFWITIATFELLIFVMTVTRGIGYLRQRCTGVAKTLYRDGILYFIYLFAISAGNVIVVYAAGGRSHPYVLLLGVLQSSLHSVLSCRLVLHIRASAERRVLMLRSDGSDLASDRTS